MRCRVDDAERSAHHPGQIVVPPSFQEPRCRVADYHWGPNTCDELFRLLPVLTLQIEVAAPEGFLGDSRADFVEEGIEEAPARAVDRTVEFVANFPYVACRIREVVEGARNRPVARRPEAQGSVPLGICGRCEPELR